MAVRSGALETGPPPALRKLGAIHPPKVRTDQLALLFALVVAANLVLLIALQLPRLGRRRARGETTAVDGDFSRTTATVPSDARSDGLALQQLLTARGLPPALYQRITRVVSYVFIGSAMAIVVLTGTAETTAIVVLLAFALIVIELFQDVLPSSALGRLRRPVEAAIVVVLLTVLVALTGGVTSPYFFGYILVVGGAALSVSEVAAATLAVVSSAAYLVAVISAADGEALSAADVGVVAFNLVSIALVMYFASVIGQEHRRAREAALELSRFDPLTGLLTKRFFDIALEAEILRATRTQRTFAVILADLDGLKAANDEFGYETGDDLLRAVAGAIRGAVRATDVVARNSTAADEFFVMLPETDQAGADVVAENIRLDIARIEISRTSRTVRSTASIGVVSFPEDGRTPADLMRRAAEAMKTGKRQLGGNRVVRYERDATAIERSTHVERSRTTQRERLGAAAVPEASPGPAPWESR